WNCHCPQTWIWIVDDRGDTEHWNVVGLLHQRVAPNQHPHQPMTTFQTHPLIARTSNSPHEQLRTVLGRRFPSSLPLGTGILVVFGRELSNHLRDVNRLHTLTLSVLYCEANIDPCHPA